MRRQDVEQLAASTKALLNSIHSGELAASTATRHRLEGAMAALDAVLDRGSSVLDLAACTGDEAEDQADRGAD